MMLSVEDLSIGFPFDNVYRMAIRGVSFQLNAGEILGVVGESGCGKSITNFALMGLLPENTRIAAKKLEICGNNLLQMDKRKWRQLRGSTVAMIFQDPMNALNPSFTVESQLLEVIRKTERGIGYRAATNRAVELLDMVGIVSPRSRLRSYPHELSGGMAQRVMIAMAIASRPSLLIADEPTTALDVTIQAQILTLLQEIRQETNMGMILVSHDIGLIQQYADRIQVMYSGEIIETGAVKDIIGNPGHPYTRGLLGSLPDRERKVPKSRLNVIPGQVPPIEKVIEGCRF